MPLAHARPACLHTAYTAAGLYRFPGGLAAAARRQINGAPSLKTKLNRSKPWASAHRDKWGQLTPPWKMDEKLKSENRQKEQFSVFVLYFESNQDRQV